MLLAVVLLIYTMTVIFDFVPSAKELSKKTKAIYWLILTFSLFVLSLYALDINVPSPAGLIRSIVEKIIKPLK